MRNVRNKLKSIATRGKYNAYAYIPIKSGDTLKKDGCTVELLCKGRSHGLFYIDWSKDSGSFGAELKSIADKAKGKR